MWSKSILQEINSIEEENYIDDSLQCNIEDTKEHIEKMVGSYGLAILFLCILAPKHNFENNKILQTLINKGQKNEQNF